MEQLVQLIGTLTAAEKKHFRLQAERTERKGGKLYLALFDIIERQGEIVLGQSRTHRQLADNLPYHKNYLYGQLLRSLRCCDQTLDRRIQMYQALTEIRILVKKGLIHQARKKIKATKKKLRKYHFEVLLMELLMMERSIVRGFTSHHSYSQLESVQCESRKIVDQLGNRLRITDLYDNIYLLARNRALKNLDAKAIRKETVRSEKPMLQMNLSFEGKVAYHLLFSLFYQQFSENIDRAAFHLRSILDIYHASPYLIQEHLLRYVHLLNNYFNNLYLLGEFSEFNGIVSRLLELRVPDAVTKLKIRYLTLHMYLLKSMQEKDVSAIKEVLPQLAGEIDSFTERIPHSDLLMLRQSMVLGYFITKEHDITLEWIRQLLNEARQEIRQDVRILCAELELLIHYNRRSEDLVESLARSIIRQTNNPRNLEPYGAFANQLARAVRRAVRTHSVEARGIFRETRQQLLGYKTYINGKEEVLWWLESEEV